MNITQDEAYTYMNTGRIQDFWQMYQFRIANTHILNSLMMVVSTLFFTYSDFAIRFPNVLLSIIYVCISFSLSKLYRNRLLLFGLLTLFYFMLTFMAQGRGYGMSATFILAALFVYHSKDKFRDRHLWIAFLLILAIYANYVAIAPSIALAAYYFFFDLKRKIPAIPKKTKRWIIALVVIGLYGFFFVTLEGKPLYGAYEAGFFEAIPFEYLKLFSPEFAYSLPVVTAISIGIALIIVLLFILKKQVPYGIMILTTFGLIALMAFVGSKPLPTGRVLIPFWPMLILAIMELIEKASFKLKVPVLAIRALNLFFIGILVFNIWGQMQTEELLASKSEQWKFPLRILSNYGVHIEPEELYSIQKDNRHEIIHDMIPAYQFEEILDGEIRIRNYEDLDMLAIEFPSMSEDHRIFREAYLNNERVYKDTLLLDTKKTLYQETDTGARLYMPYPKMEADRLTIGGIDEKWEGTIQIDRP